MSLIFFLRAVEVPIFGRWYDTPAMLYPDLHTSPAPLGLIFPNFRPHHSPTFAKDIILEGFTSPPAARRPNGERMSQLENFRK